MSPVKRRALELGLTVHQPASFKTPAALEMLRAAQIEVLRTNNILYDRDEAGEYFQAYTRAFEDLFFFEIVERRAYKGFGAVNASIRLAAQTRELAR